MNKTNAPVTATSPRKISANDELLEVWHMLSTSSGEGGGGWAKDMRLGPAYVRGRDLAAFFRRHPEYNSGKASWTPTNLRVAEDEIFSEIPLVLEM